ncbi:hypothetical protein GCM10028774_61920 [Spirosoma jeollabukense]
MNKKSKDFGAVKNSITGKIIREMTWDEILSLPVERMSREEAMKRIRETQLAKKNK